MRAVTRKKKNTNILFPILNIVNKCLEEKCHDIVFKKVQLQILFHLEYKETFNDECIKIPCCSALDIVKDIIQKDVRKHNALHLTDLEIIRTFFIADLKYPVRNCCTEQFMSLWLHEEIVSLKSIKNTVRCIEKVLTVATYSWHILMLMRTALKQIGPNYCGLYFSMLKKALILDQANLESSSNAEEINFAKRGLYTTCLGLAVYTSIPQLKKWALLTAFSLIPNQQIFALLKDAYTTEVLEFAKRCSTKVENCANLDIRKTETRLANALMDIMENVRDKTIMANMSWDLLEPKCLHYMSQYSLDIESNSCVEALPVYNQQEEMMFKECNHFLLNTDNKGELEEKKCSNERPRDNCVKNKVSKRKKTKRKAPVIKKTTLTKEQKEEYGQLFDQENFQDILYLISMEEMCSDLLLCKLEAGEEEQINDLVKFQSNHFKSDSASLIGLERTSCSDAVKLEISNDDVDKLEDENCRDLDKLQASIAEGWDFSKDSDFDDVVKLETWNRSGVIQVEAINVSDLVKMENDTFNGATDIYTCNDVQLETANSTSVKLDANDLVKLVDSASNDATNSVNVKLECTKDSDLVKVEDITYNDVTQTDTYCIDTIKLELNIRSVEAGTNGDIVQSEGDNGSYLVKLGNTTGLNSDEMDISYNDSFPAETSNKTNVKLEGRNDTYVVKEDAVSNPVVKMDIRCCDTVVNNLHISDESACEITGVSCKAEQNGTKRLIHQMGEKQCIVDSNISANAVYLGIPYDSQVLTNSRFSVNDVNTKSTTIVKGSPRKVKYTCNICPNGAIFFSIVECMSHMHGFHYFISMQQDNLSGAMYCKLCLHFESTEVQMKEHMEFGHGVNLKMAECIFSETLVEYEEYEVHSPQKQKDKNRKEDKVHSRPHKQRDNNRKEDKVHSHPQKHKGNNRKEDKVHSRPQKQKDNNRKEDKVHSRPQKHKGNNRKEDKVHSPEKQKDNNRKEDKVHSRPQKQKENKRKEDKVHSRPQKYKGSNRKEDNVHSRLQKHKGNNRKEDKVHSCPQKQKDNYRKEDTVHSQQKHKDNNRKEDKVHSRSQKYKGNNRKEDKVDSRPQMQKGNNMKEDKVHSPQKQKANNRKSNDVNNNTSYDDNNFTYFNTLAETLTTNNDASQEDLYQKRSEKHYRASSPIVQLDGEIDQDCKDSSSNSNETSVSDTNGMVIKTLTGVDFQQVGNTQVLYLPEHNVKLVVEKVSTKTGQYLETVGNNNGITFENENNLAYSCGEYQIECDKNEAYNYLDVNDSNGKMFNDSMVQEVSEENLGKSVHIQEETRITRCSSSTDANSSGMCDIKDKPFNTDWSGSNSIVSGGHNLISFTPNQAVPCVHMYSDSTDIDMGKGFNKQYCDSVNMMNDENENLLNVNIDLTDAVNTDDPDDPPLSCSSPSCSTMAVEENAMDCNLSTTLHLDELFSILQDDGNSLSKIEEGESHISCDIETSSYLMPSHSEYDEHQLKSQSPVLDLVIENIQNNTTKKVQPIQEIIPCNSTVILEDINSGLENTTKKDQPIQEIIPCKSTVILEDINSRLENTTQKDQPIQEIKSKVILEDLNSGLENTTTKDQPIQEIIPCKTTVVLEDINSGLKKNTQKDQPIQEIIPCKSKVILEDLNSGLVNTTKKDQPIQAIIPCNSTVNPKDINSRLGNTIKKDQPIQEIIQCKTTVILEDINSGLENTTQKDQPIQEIKSKVILEENSPDEQFENRNYDIVQQNMTETEPVFDSNSKPDVSIMTKKNVSASFVGEDVTPNQNIDHKLKDNQQDLKLLNFQNVHDNSSEIDDDKLCIIGTLKELVEVKSEAEDMYDDNIHAAANNEESKTRKLRYGRSVNLVEHTSKVKKMEHKNITDTKGKTFVFKKNRTNAKGKKKVASKEMKKCKLEYPGHVMYTCLLCTKCRSFKTTNNIVRHVKHFHNHVCLEEKINDVKVISSSQGDYVCVCYLCGKEYDSAYAKSCFRLHMKHCIQKQAHKNKNETESRTMKLKTTKQTPSKSDLNAPGLCTKRKVIDKKQQEVRKKLKIDIDPGTVWMSKKQVIGGLEKVKLPASVKIKRSHSIEASISSQTKCEERTVEGELKVKKKELQYHLHQSTKDVKELKVKLEKCSGNKKTRKD